MPCQIVRDGERELMIDTLIVWTEPQSNLDIALSFQDPDGCEDIWSFVCDVQRHLNNLPSKSSIRSTLAGKYWIS